MGVVGGEVRGEEGAGDGIIAKIGDETLIDHIVDNLTRGIERAALVARCLLSLGIVSTEEVLKDLAE